MTEKGKEEIKFIYTGFQLKVERGPVGFEPDTDGEVLTTYPLCDEIDWMKAQRYRRAMDGIRSDSFSPISRRLLPKSI